MVDNALVLAATRRLIRRPDAPLLDAVRSLAYFLPVIEEVPELRVNPDYFQYLRHKLSGSRPRRGRHQAAQLMKNHIARLGVNDIACASNLSRPAFGEMLHPKSTSRSRPGSWSGSL